MALTIKKIDNVFCIKGTCPTGQLKNVKILLFNHLQKEENVLVNLCLLEGDIQEMTDMLYRVKMSLVNPSRLDYYGHVKIKKEVKVRHLELIPTRTLEVA